MSDSYKTDDWILKIFEDWYDPCPFNPDWNPYDYSDGLMTTWQDKTFVNPPYSNPKPWVEKAILENKVNNFTVALLLKHDSSTKWYSLLHSANAKIFMLQGRLKFNTGKSCSFPSILAVLI